jgi:hypothetical protein
MTSNRSTSFAATLPRVTNVLAGVGRFDMPRTCLESVGSATGTQ